jgi:hypothetical protein
MWGCGENPESRLRRVAPSSKESSSGRGSVTASARQ